MENKKIHPLHAAHMEPTKEMLGLSALETAKHWNQPTEPYKWGESLSEEKLTNVVKDILEESPKFDPMVLKSEEFRNAIDDHIENENQKALTATQKIKQKHFDKIKKQEMNEQIQNRFNASGIIHNEFERMAIPGAIPPQALFYLNPVLPMIIEGAMQDNLWKIQGVKFKK